MSNINYTSFLLNLKDPNLDFNNSSCYFASNGPLEGINNIIKALKRIAFGYRSFFNFRNRILIMNYLICIEKTV